MKAINSIIILVSALTLSACKQQIDVVDIATFDTHVCAVSVPSSSNPNPVQCWGETNPLPSSPERAEELAAFQASIKNPVSIATTDIGVCVVDNVQEPSRLKCITSDAQPKNILNPTYMNTGSTIGAYLSYEVQDISIAKNPDASYTLCSTLKGPTSTQSDIGCWPARESIDWTKLFRFRSIFEDQNFGSRWPGFPSRLDYSSDTRFDKPSLASGQVCLRISFYDTLLNTRRYNGWCTNLVTKSDGRFSPDLSGSNPYNLPPTADVVIDTGDVFSIHALSISDRLNKRYCVVRSLGQSSCEGRPELPPFGWLASVGPTQGDPDTFFSCSYRNCFSADGTEVYVGLVKQQDKPLSEVSVERRYACTLIARDPSKQSPIRAVRCVGQVPATTPDSLKG